MSTSIQKDAFSRVSRPLCPNNLVNAPLSDTVTKRSFVQSMIEFHELPYNR